MDEAVFNVIGVDNAFPLESIAMYFAFKGFLFNDA